MTSTEFQRSQSEYSTQISCLCKDIRAIAVHVNTVCWTAVNIGNPVSQTVLDSKYCSLFGFIRLIQRFPSLIFCVSFHFGKISFTSSQAILFNELSILFFGNSASLPLVCLTVGLNIRLQDAMLPKASCWNSKREHKNAWRQERPKTLTSFSESGPSMRVRECALCNNLKRFF